ncbi:hypothetical protein DSECCO2_381310 [anaerobic digester metagenome]
MDNPAESALMAPIPMTFFPPQGSVPEQESQPAENVECLIAPTLYTDGAGRALILYQRMIESGFNCSQVMTGA